LSGLAQHRRTTDRCFAGTSDAGAFVPFDLMPFIRA
jgi:hypothetical protein